MIVVDVEASGPDPCENGLVSIGAVEFENPKNFFYGECRLRKGAVILKEVPKIIGMSKKEMLRKDKMSTKELLKKFFLWSKKIKDKRIAGLTPFFDYMYLYIESKRANLKLPFSHHTFDLRSVFYLKHIYLKDKIPKQKDNLDSIAKFVGIKIKRKFHNALEDAKLETECFYRLIYKKKIFPEYKKFPIPSYLK